MTLEQALRGVAKAIAPLHTPRVRGIIGSNIPEKVATGDSNLWMTLEEFAACFHPGDAIKAKDVLSQLKSAHSDGQIFSIHESFFSAETLSIWPERPKIAHDSPLVYWFGASEVNIQQQADTVPTPEYTLEKKPQKKRASWQEELPYIVEIYLSTQQPKVKGLWRELKAKAGREDSPFIVGKGIDRDKLIVKRNGATLMEHTLGTNMRKVRELANKGN